MFYFGKKLLRDADLAAAHTAAYAFESAEGMAAEEYPGWGGMRSFEPCLKVTTMNGTRDLVLKYVSHEIRGGDSLDIRVKDARYGRQPAPGPKWQPLRPRHSTIATTAPQYDIVCGHRPGCRISCFIRLL